MNKKRIKRGISLIVLVITIIVMIILAGAIIISLTNGNVISKAKQAVSETNDANIREQIGVAMLSHSFEETETLKECLQKISGATVEDTNNPDKYSYVTMKNMLYTVFEDGRVKKGKYIMWLGGVATGYASGAGTEASPYVIETPEQLAYLSQQVSVGTLYSGIYFRLDNNLDLTGVKNLESWSGTEWNSIGDKSHIFAGIFDGNNKIISGIYMMALSDKTSGIEGQGLFGANSGTVKNIGVEDSYISGYKCIAGVVGYSTGTVENCYNTGEIRSDYYTAGSPEIGGIVGKNYGTVSTCYNTGNVTTATVSTSNSGTAGVVGTNANLIENCYNTGNITGFSSIGGIVGYAISDAATTPKIIGCYNTGKIISNRQQAGGIIGQSNRGSIENCYNTGYIKANFTSDVSFEGTMVGGIAGVNKGTILNCYNTANIVTEKSASGGIAGLNYATIRNCRNEGTITAGASGAGGITAYTMDAASVVEDSYNSGNITALTQYAGGIVGRHSVAGAAIKYSYNKGIVTSPLSVGGVIGKVHVAGTITQGCYYLTGTATRGIGTNVSVDGVDSAGVVESTNENIASYESFVTWIATKK